MTVPLFLLGACPGGLLPCALTSALQTPSLQWELDPDGLIELKGKVQVL
jgi:hypothetical protein